MKKIVNPLLFVIILICLFNMYELANQTEDVFIQTNNKLEIKQEELDLKQEEIKILKGIINSQSVQISEYLDEIKELRTIRNVRVTAYSPLDDRNGINSEGNPHYTSTGVRVGQGVIAVDPSEISYGTKLKIPGYGNGIACDTGGALRNYTEGIAIDVCFDTYEEAMKWGVRYLDVKIK